MILFVSFSSFRSSDTLSSCSLSSLYQGMQAGAAAREHGRQAIVPGMRVRTVRHARPSVAAQEPHSLCGKWRAACSAARKQAPPSPRPCAGAMGKHRGRRTSKHAAGERVEQSPPGGKRMSRAPRARHRRRGRCG